ncbi:MAG TPA: penicillin acylase family protein [Planctomycetota bacterium]|nr:penicillin acylase family protein [Planctomycetota bacterium]
MEVVLLRDAWGVPHVYAQTDHAAFYGLGWAAAEDRLFQMLHARLMAQGRLAEFFGPGLVPDQGSTYLAHDIEARRLGWRRQAHETAAALDAETQSLLAAYAQGVNEYMSSPGAVLNPLIAQHALPLEEWRVEDCIVVWMRFAAHFGTNGTEEVSVLRKWETLLGSMSFDAAYDEMISGVVCDDEAAVVQPSDVPASTQQAMADYAALHGLDAPGHCPIPLEAPKFSQTWAVAGSRTYAGRAVLVGDPRSEVFRPNHFYEWSVEGATFSARGVGVAGSPNMICGSSAHAAWSATALGMDQADLFELTTDPVRQPGQYLLDGQWRDFEVDEIETVLVLGEPSKLIDYRETVWGPVVTKLIDAALPGEEFSVCRVPFHDAARDAAVGSIRMLRSGGLDEFYAALADWSFPSINVVFADDTGRVGFAVAGDAPVRPGGLVLAGVIPQDGSASASGWLEVLPHGLEPHVLDPASGVLYSANHMPIGSWYPIPVRFGTGAAGDTTRSRRLAELLDALPSVVDASEVEALRFDRVNTARRDLAELGLWLRDSQPSFVLSAEALAALGTLEPWWLAGAAMDGVLPGATLAWHLDLEFHPAQAGQALIESYGGGENGLVLFLKSQLDAIGAAQPLGIEAAEFIDRVLADAWNEAVDLGPPDTWPIWFQNEVLTFELLSWETLAGLPPPAGGAAPLWIGPVSCADGGALCTTPSQSYTQVVEPGVGGPVARSLLAPGTSEHAGPHELDQVSLWEANLTKPAPRTQAEVQASGPFTETVLRYTAAPE